MTVSVEPDEALVKPVAGAFAGATSLTLVSSLLSGFVTLAAAVILNRTIGPSGSGQYQLALVPAALALIFVNLGIGVAMTYQVARRSLSLHELVGQAILLSILLGLAGALIMGSVVVLAPNGLSPGIAVRYGLLALVGLPAVLVLTALGGVALGLQRYGAYSFLLVVRALATAAGTVVGLLVATDRLFGAVFGGVVGQATVAFAATLWFRHLVGRLAYRLRWRNLRETLSFGAKVSATNLIGFLNYRVDVILAAHYLSVGAVGLYGAAFLGAERLWLVSNAASSALLPRVARDDTADMSRASFTALVMRVVIIATGIGSLALFFVSPVLLPLLFSSHFAGAVSPLQLLLPGMIALAGARVLATDIAARGSPGLNAMISAAGLAVNVMLNVLWLPRFGVMGAAGASSVSYTMLFLMQMGIFRRRTGLTVRRIVVPGMADLRALRVMFGGLSSRTRAAVRELSPGRLHSSYQD